MTEVLYIADRRIDFDLFWLQPTRAAVGTEAFSSGLVLVTFQQTLVDCRIAVAAFAAGLPLEGRWVAFEQPRDGAHIVFPAPRFAPGAPSKAFDIEIVALLNDGRVGRSQRLTAREPAPDEEVHDGPAILLAKPDLRPVYAFARGQPGPAIMRLDSRMIVGSERTSAPAVQRGGGDPAAIRLTLTSPSNEHAKPSAPARTRMELGHGGVQPPKHRLLVRANRRGTDRMLPTLRIAYANRQRLASCLADGRAAFLQLKSDLARSPPSEREYALPYIGPGDILVVFPGEDCLVEAGEPQTPARAPIAGGAFAVYQIDRRLRLLPCNPQSFEPLEADRVDRFHEVPEEVTRKLANEIERAQPWILDSARVRLFEIDALCTYCREHWPRAAQSGRFEQLADAAPTLPLFCLAAQRFADLVAETYADDALSHLVRVLDPGKASFLERLWSPALRHAASEPSKIAGLVAAGARSNRDPFQDTDSLEPFFHTLSEEWEANVRPGGLPLLQPSDWYRKAQADLDGRLALVWLATASPEGPAYAARIVAAALVPSLDILDFARLIPQLDFAERFLCPQRQPLDEEPIPALRMADDDLKNFDQVEAQGLAEMEGIADRLALVRGAPPKAWQIPLVSVRGLETWRKLVREADIRAEINEIGTLLRKENEASRTSLRTIPAVSRRRSGADEEVAEALKAEAGTARSAEWRAMIDKSAEWRPASRAALLATLQAIRHAAA